MPIIPFEGHTPKIHPTAFIAPTALVLGNVEIGPHASIWYGVVLRGDLEAIKIGARSNVQDNSVLHTGLGEPTLVGDDVTIGHLAIVHGATVQRGALIGMGSCVLNRAVIGEESIIGAKALVTEGRQVDPRSLMAGVPAKFIRRVLESDLEPVKIFTQRYVKNGERHQKAWEAFDSGVR